MQPHTQSISPESTQARAAEAVLAFLRPPLDAEMAADDVEASAALVDLAQRALFDGLLTPDHDPLGQPGVELWRIDGEIGALLAGDPRDAEDIPGYDALDGRRTEILLGLDGAEPDGLPGLLAIARIMLLRRTEEEGPDRWYIGWTLADAVVRIAEAGGLGPAGSGRM